MIVLDLLFYLIVGLLALLLLGAIVAPLESLGWWAGWYGQQADDSFRKTAPELLAGAGAVDANHWLVYLSGIGVPSGDQQLETEVPFIEALQRHLPRTVVTSDVFPYSVTNLGLNGERMIGWFWERAEEARKKNPYAWQTWLVNARNMLQVAVSADNRYGPVYNVGVAREILRSLLQNGYHIGSGKPVTLFGYSGGGQVSLGVAPYLKKVIKAPIRIISLGGVMSSDPGLDVIDALYHLDGTKDKTDDMGIFIFPGRWRWAAGSSWNRARAEGKIKVKVIGPFAHTGAGGYLDMERQVLDGRTHIEVTLGEVLQILKQWGVDQPLPVTPESLPKPAVSAAALPQGAAMPEPGATTP
jgi:hypothetical protein